MTQGEDKSYGLEPSDAEAPVGPVPAGDTADAEPAAEGAAARSEVPAGGACPACGAARRGEDGRCLRCGWRPGGAAPGLGDASATPAPARPEPPPGDPEDEDEYEDDGRAGVQTAPVVRPLPGERWLVPALGATGVLALVIGAIAGAPGLFAAVDAAPEGPMGTVSGWRRVEAAVRLPTLVGVWTACGVAALWIFAWLEARPLGEPRRVAFRMLAIVAPAATLLFVSLPHPWIEFPAETAGQVIVFTLLARPLLGLAWRESLTLIAITLVLTFVVHGVAHFLAWAL